MPLAKATRPFPALAALAALSLAAPSGVHASGGVGDMFVTSDASNVVRAYDDVGGTYLGIHSTSVLGAGQLAIHFGTNGRFLVGAFGGGVDEFDSASGAYIKTYAPAGGWQWAGLYAPNGNVLISSVATNDVREYDPVTGALIQVFCPVFYPSDMRIGPNGNLWVCSYGGNFVAEFDITNGNLLNQWPMPVNSRPNDIAFLPNGDVLVTVMGNNVVYHLSPAMVMLGSFAGTGWDRPHGIEIGPLDGNIYVVDGVTTQVHVFDPVTFVELNAAFLTPGAGDKIVDIDFRPGDGPVPVTPATWGAIKNLLD